jgi:RHS repeat-associated protein
VKVKPVANDVKGNATSRPATLAAPALNLTWDFGNQLSGVDTNGTPASLEVTFRYDVLGRRVGRAEGASSVIFVQAGQQTIADYDAGQVPTKPNQIYVYGSYIDEPIARRESQSLAYFHRNPQYSIVAISNTSGAVIERYSYTAHGQPTVYDAAGTIIPAPTFGNRFTYTGREWDATLALHYFRARWYDPLAGRFISRDPLGYVDGLNSYKSFTGLGGLDPFGMEVQGGRPRMDDKFPDFVRGAFGTPCDENCDFAADLCRECLLLDSFWNSESGARDACEPIRDDCKRRCQSQRAELEAMGLDPNSPNVFVQILPDLTMGFGGIALGKMSGRSESRGVRVAGRTTGAAISVYGWWSAYLTIAEVRSDYRKLLANSFRYMDGQIDELRTRNATNCRGTRFHGVFYPGFLNNPEQKPREDFLSDSAYGFWIEPCDQSSAADRTVDVFAYGFFGELGWQKTIVVRDIAHDRTRQCLTWDELLRIEMEMMCNNSGKRPVEPSK